MIAMALARASALALLPGMLGCSSHVDVGFSSIDGGVLGDAAQENAIASLATLSDANDEPVPACFAGPPACDGCPPSRYFADWCSTDACRRPYAVCHDVCVDTDTDPENCGHCDHECFAHSCVAGVCTN
jgi:hypothetical protein